MICLYHVACRLHHLYLPRQGIMRLGRYIQVVQATSDVWEYVCALIEKHDHHHHHHHRASHLAPLSFAVDPSSFPLQLVAGQRYLSPRSVAGEGEYRAAAAPPVQEKGNLPYIHRYSR